MKLIDGTGKSYGAQVNDANQLEVHASVAQQQHWYSEVKGQAYQVHGITDTLTSATVPILHLLNTSSDKEVIVTYIRHQVIDTNATIPATDNYFGVGFGRTYSSGGTAITPTNMNTGSGNAAEVTCYHSTPTLTGTNTEIDRYYNESEASLLIYNKQGSIVIAPNDTLELYYVSTATAGIAYARLSFYMQPIGAG